MISQRGVNTDHATIPDIYHGVATVRGSIRKIPGWIPTRRIVRHHRVGVGVSTSSPGFPRFEQCVAPGVRNHHNTPYFCGWKMAIVGFAPWCR